MNALILLAHGSKNPEAVKEVEEMSEVLAKRFPESSICHAYLELARPTLPERLNQVSNQGARSVLVLPLFLSAGSHVTKDVPQMLADARDTYPDVTFRLLPHIGSHPGYFDLVKGIVENPDEFLEKDNLG
jgi:sirohydrochlorin ferrochelatase